MLHQAGLSVKGGKPQGLICVQFSVEHRRLDAIMLWEQAEGAAFSFTDLVSFCVLKFFSGGISSNERKNYTE